MKYFTKLPIVLVFVFNANSLFAYTASEITNSKDTRISCDISLLVKSGKDLETKTYTEGKFFSEDTILSDKTVLRCFNTTFDNQSIDPIVSCFYFDSRDIREVSEGYLHLVNKHKVTDEVKIDFQTGLGTRKLDYYLHSYGNFFGKKRTTRAQIKNCVLEQKD